MNNYEQIILIGGPTASGKSALAMALAKSLGDCAIINADSLQLYADLQIITARPSETEFQGVPHYLYGVLSADYNTNAAWWQTQALGILCRLLKRHQRAVIVGGTGLYFTSLIRGLSVIPPIPPDISKNVRCQAQTLSIEELQAWAYAVDPLITGQLFDRQRLGRALEVKLATGQSITTLQGYAKPPIDNFRFITLCPPRALLYERINQRFIAIMAAGAITEVERLLSLPLPSDAPALKALGVREITAYIQGAAPLDMVISQAQQASRHYAKRQVTWFRHQVPQDIVITDATWDLDAILSAL